MTKFFSGFWKYVVGINLFFLFTTVLLQYSLHVPYLKRFLAPFDLATEMNVAVWWSGIILLTVGLIAYEVSLDNSDKARFAWFVLSIVLIGLSIDEICSLHERVGGWKRLVPYASVIFVLFVVAFVILLRDRKTRSSALLILSGFLSFGFVAVQEYLEHLFIWPHWISGIRVGMEEGSELFGTLLIMLGVIPRRRVACETSFPSIAPLIPNPEEIKGSAVFLFIGLVVSLAVSYFIFPILTDTDRRGNPALWYPTTVYFMISCFLFWEAQKKTISGYRLTYCLSLLFLVSSIYCMYPFYKIIPVITRIIPKGVFEYSILYIVQIGGFLILHKKGKPLVSRKINIFKTGFVAVMIVSFFVPEVYGQLMLLSLAACFAAFIIIKPPISGTRPLRPLALTLNGLTTKLRH